MLGIVAAVGHLARGPLAVGILPSTSPISTRRIRSADGLIAFSTEAPGKDDNPADFFPEQGIDYALAPPQSGGTDLHVPNTNSNMFYRGVRGRW